VSTLSTARLQGEEAKGGAKEVDALVGHDGRFLTLDFRFGITPRIRPRRRTK